MTNTIDSTSKSAIFCSVIIPTIGRKSLSRTVESALNQNISDVGYEVLVINDSGIPLPKAEWQEVGNVKIITTNRRERSVARNLGAAMAKGQYLHFLDDDDWLAPGAYKYFYELSKTSQAQWLYGITELVDRNNAPTIRLRHNFNGNCFLQVMSGEWIPLQSSLIHRRAFMRVGGFNPLLAASEDIDLLRRFLLEEEIAGTPNLIAHVTMGRVGSTTDYARHPQASRSARENILDNVKSFARMRSSASNAFWRGRMLRIYLTSTVWNMAHARFFGALSRFFLSVTVILYLGKNLMEKSFWRAVLKPYTSITFEKGIQEAKRGR